MLGSSFSGVPKAQEPLLSGKHLSGHHRGRGRQFPPQNPELCSASRICSSGKQPGHKRSLLAKASYREGNCPKCDSAAELGEAILPLPGRLREPFPAQCFSLSASNHSQIICSIWCDCSLQSCPTQHRWPKPDIAKHLSAVHSKRVK